MIDTEGRVKAVENGIIKPICDENKYRVIELSNSLRVLLVQDENTDLSAATLSVFVGCQEDPEELNGLAHFLEHMLFLGSERHPDPCEFDDFMKLNGGNFNAMTDSMTTTYYFEIKNESFYHALDIFSAFFICPLFDTEYVDREVNAVNSEYNKNLLSDVWIRYHIISSIAREGHPLRKFGTGNIDTLKNEPEKKGIDVIKELKKFHHTHYSSNIMFLTLFSNSELDELERVAIKYFSDIVNKNIKRVDYFENFQDERPYLSIKESKKDGALESVVYIAPNKDERKVSFNFQLPDLRRFRRGLPEMYFSNILGHEGPGSLTAALRRNGWCLALSSGMNEVYSANLFEITIDLTEKGSREILKVMEYTLNFVNLVVKSEVDANIIEDLEKLSQLVFDYKNRLTLDDIINHNLFALANEPPLNEILSFGNRIEKVDIEAVNYLKRYFDFSNMFILISIPENKTLLKDERLKDKLIYDKYYNVFYLKLEFCPELNEIISQISLLNADKFGLRMPKKNKYIPEDLTLMNKLEASGKYIQPTEIDLSENYFNNRVRAYFKPDTNFHTPHGFSQFFFFSTGKLTCESIVLTTLVSSTLSKLVAEEAYDAKVANLDYKISGGILLGNPMDCVSITISGFNDKMETLLGFIIKSLINLKNDVNYKKLKLFFDDALEECKINVRNSLSSPDILAHLTNYYLKEFYSDYTPSKEEIISVLNSITFDKLCIHIDNFFSQCLVRSITIGNLNSDKARNMVEVVMNKELLSSNSDITKGNKTTIRACIDIKAAIDADPELKSERLIFSKPVLNPLDKNGCVIYNFDMGKYNLENYVILELLSRYLDSNSFQELRTNQQLGYIVRSTCYNIKPAIGINICVQSSDYRNTHLIHRIHDLVEELLISKLSEELNEEQFKILVDSEIKIYSNKPKNLKDEVVQYLSAITNGDCDFNWKEKAVNILRNLTYQDLTVFISRLLKRPRIVVQSVSSLDSSKNCEERFRDSVPDGFSVINDFKYFQKSDKNSNLFHIYA
ncbi:insulinase-like peptidase [Cryptosporidium felis]|nr:insulinase-like peptidase [Cryptosporidium felis]